MTGYKFQHITDEMYIGKKYNNIKTAIFEMHKKTKKKLEELKYIYDIDYSIGEPIFLEREDQNRNQYRYDIRIYKATRKISWDKIFYYMNEICPARFKKI